MAAKRLQSAMEYLTTYGWAILVIAIVAAVLFSIGVFNPTPPSSCDLPAGFTCSSVAMSNNGVLTVTLFQTTSTPVNVTAIGCNTNTTVSNTIMTIPHNPPSNQVTVQIGSDYTMSLQCYKGGVAYNGLVGSAYSGYLILNYTQQYSGLPHTLYGELSVKVS